MLVKGALMEENKSHDGKSIGKLPIAIILLAVICLFSFFLKDILVPFIKLQAQNDVDGATMLLREKGILGFAAVSLVEALQMVVIFIPAEFIQISSGLSYPFPMALALCDIGVCLGATIIFVLVRVFNIQSDAYNRRKKIIDRISEGARNKNTMVLLYLLFFMPLIPFGAICYYGSSTKLPYRRYLFTVATGVVPSIVVSNIMGAAGRAFVGRELPLWLLILIIVFLAALLFVIIAVFIKRFYFNGNMENMESPAYGAVISLFSLIHGKKQKVEIDDSLLETAGSPYIMLSNHESFFDFLYLYKLNHPRNPSFIVNEYYCTRPIARRVPLGYSIIPKKLFVTEVRTPLSIMRNIKRGCPVVLFPEGRLSPDGRSNIFLPGAALYKKIGVDLVLVKITGAYFSNPKWRKKRFLSDIKVKVERIIKKDEMQKMDADELENVIASTLFNDASENENRLFPQKDKAKGLENILYRCIDCGTLYTTKGIGNDLVCTSCGSKHSLDNHYHFTKEPYTISGYYDRIKNLEADDLDTLTLKADVRTKVFAENGKVIRKEYGQCTLTPEGLGYRSETSDFVVRMEDMPALAFSCGTEFEVYHNGNLYYFYPMENPQQTARWALLVDMFAERRKEQ